MWAGCLLYQKNAAEIGIALGASRVSVIKQRRRRDEECRVCPLRVSTCCGELLSSEVWKLLVDEKRGLFRVSRDMVLGINAFRVSRDDGQYLEYENENQLL